MLVSASTDYTTTGIINIIIKAILSPSTLNKVKHENFKLKKEIFSTLHACINNLLW